MNELPDYQPKHSFPDAVMEAVKRQERIDAGEDVTGEPFTPPPFAEGSGVKDTLAMLDRYKTNDTEVFAQRETDRANPH